MLNRTFTTVALVTLSGLAMTGCSLAEPEDTLRGPEPSSPVASSSAGAPVLEVEAAPPLDEYVDSLYGLSGGPDEQAQQLAARRNEQETLIAACMKKNGFEYTPEVFDAASFERELGTSQDDLDSVDWVGQYGYGNLETPAGKTVDADTSRDGTAAHDPNDDFVESLTPSEQRAYDKTLHGQAADPEKDLHLVDDWQQMGCSGEARHTTGGGIDPLASNAGESIDLKITAFYDSYDSWAGLPDLNGAWASCMAEAGHPGYSKQGDAQTEIAGKITAALDAAGAGNEPADAEDLLDEEREVALADLSCRQDTDFRATLHDITVKAQTLFIEDNRAELDAFAASLEQGSGR